MNAFSIIDELRKFIRRGYGDGLPSKVDHLFSQLGGYYIKCSPEDRERLRQAVDDDTRLLLVGFSDRFATIAARTGDKACLFLALVAHSIEDFRYDARENIFRLVLIEHVANRLGVEMDELMKVVIDLSSDHCANYLREYLARPSEMNTLETMGITEIETEVGVGYQYG